MARKRDPLGLSPHWHADLRLEAELPEDNVVGTRFLVNTLFASVAIVLALVTGWLAYQSVNLRTGIRELDQQIAGMSASVKDVPQMQREFMDQARKIEYAAKLVKTPFPIGGFIDDLGRSKPDRVLIESIEWNENGIFLRGNIRDTSSAFNNYVETLKKDPRISPLFSDIRSSGLERAKNDSELLNFEVKFTLGNPAP